MPTCIFTKEELAQFDLKILAIAKRTSFSSYTVERRLSSSKYITIRTQTLEHLKSGRKSAKPLTFYADSKQNSIKQKISKATRSVKKSRSFVNRRRIKKRKKKEIG